MTKIFKKLKITKMKVIALIVVAGLVGGYFAFQEKEIEMTTEIRETTATIGSVVDLLDSSGTIEAYETYDIVSLVQGEILEDTFELSSEVTENQILYTVDSSDSESNITKAENALTKQQTSYQAIVDSVDDLNIKSTMDGTIMDVFVAVGDNVSNSTQIASMINLDVLEIVLPFHFAEAQNISIGDTASVTVQEFGETIDGTVTSVSNGSYISSKGSQVSEVRIEVKNPGVLTDVYTGSAVVNGSSSADTGDFTYKYTTTLTAGTSGELTSVNIMKGDYVTLNQIIAVAYDEDMEDTLEDAELTLDDAISDYQTTIDSLDDYYITSPINGTIMSKNYKAGDTITSTNNTTLAIVADMSRVKFEMSVDETNVSLLEVGTEVIVTADAIDYRTYTGHIESIGLIGSQSSGVTTYPVVVVVDDTEGLLPGMNITADIIIDQAVDVVTLPSSYVSRGNMVLISEEDASNYQVTETAEVGKVSSADSGIEGYVYLYIEIGLSDGTTVAIPSGLQAGTTVYMQSVVATGANEVTEEAGFSMPGMTTGATSGVGSNISSDRGAGASVSGPGGR